MRENKRITLYGAVTSVPNGSTNLNWKQDVRQITERLLFRLNAAQQFDYRNFVSPGTYNLGDHAISIAVAQQIGSVHQEISIDKIDWGKLDTHVKQASIIFAGSGYFYIESSKMPAERIANDSLIIQKQGASYSHFGVGVNYVGKDTTFTVNDIPDAGQKMVAENLALAKTISVRDKKSQEILQPLTSTSISVTGDPALFIKSYRISPTKAPPSNKSLVIGINIPFHGPVPSARVSRELKFYIELFKKLQNTSGCRFIQTIHYHSEIVIGKILQDHGIQLTQAIGDVQTLLDAYQEMDFHIGGMLHSCILSASVGTPPIGLAYDIKHQGFFDLLGQPDLCIPEENFDLERLATVCERVMGQTQTIRAQINARRDELEVESNRFLAQTLQALLN